jgi:hypothetical protein
MWRLFVRSTYLLCQHFMTCRRLFGTDGLPTTPVGNRVQLRLCAFGIADISQKTAVIHTRTAAHRSLSLQPLFVLGSRGFRDQVYNNCEVFCMYNNLFPLSFSVWFWVHMSLEIFSLAQYSAPSSFSSCSNCLLSVLSCFCAMWEIPPRLLGRGCGCVRWVFEPQLWDLYIVQLLLGSVCLFV